MLWWPYVAETTILTRAKVSVLNDIHLSIKPSEKDEYLIDGVAPSKQVFKGWVKEDSFLLSLLLGYHQQFLPIIHGRIEESSRGSIVFIQYKLISSTQFFFFIGLGMCLFSAFAFVLLDSNWSYAAFALSIIGVYYVLMMINFQRFYKQSQEQLREILYV